MKPIGTEVGTVYPVAPPIPLPAVDSRTAALQTLAEYISELTFYRPGDKGGPAVPFSIPVDRIYVEQPDNEESMTLPAILLDSAGEATLEDLQYYDEDSKDVFGRGTCLFIVGEHVEQINIRVFTRYRAERRALLAGLERALSPVEEIYGLNLLCDSYYRQTASYCPLSSARTDGDDSANNRREGSFKIDLRVNVVRLANYREALNVVNVSVVDPDDRVVFNPTVQTPAPTPVVSALSPTSQLVDSPSFTLVVTGSSFAPTSQVFIGNLALSTKFVDSSRLESTVPATSLLDAGSTQQVSVRTPAPGGGVSGNLPFVVTSPVPTIATIYPSSLSAGTGTAYVVINGSGFQRNAVVQINTSQVSYTYTDSTKLVASFDLGTLPVGSYTLSVTNPAPGGGTASVVLTVASSAGNPVPTITNVSTTAFTAGVGDVANSLTGTGFNASSLVYIDGNPVPTTYVSPTSLTFTTPTLVTGAPGNHSLVVTNPVPGGGSSSAVTLAVSYPVPILSWLYVSSALVGSGAVTTRAVLSPASYAATTAQVDGVGVTASKVDVLEIDITIPSAVIAVPGPHAVTVTNPTPGGGTSGSFTFNSTLPLPTLSLGTTSTTYGSGNLPISVTGSGFYTGYTTFKVDGVAVSSTITSTTTATITIPSSVTSSAGTHSVTAVNATPGGGTSTAATFTVNHASPTLTGVAPSSVNAGSGNTTIACTGTGYDPSSVVFAGTTSLVTTYVSPTSVTAVVPSTMLSSAGSLTITIQNPTPGGGTSGSTTLTIAAVPPSTTSLGTSTGERWFAARSNTINGAAFDSTARVTFGSTSGIVPTSFTSASITFTIPDSELDSTGAKTVTVTTSAGTSNSQTYTVTQPAALRGEWRADVGITLNGSTVQSWANQISGDANMNLSQLTAARQPTYVSSDAAYSGKPLLSFASANNQYMQTAVWAVPLAQPATWAVIGETSTTTAALIDGIDSAARHELGNNGSNEFINGGTLITGTGVASQAVHIMALNGASSAGYRSSSTTTFVTGNAGTNQLNGLTIGQSYNLALPMTGKIAAVYAWNVALTQTQRAQFGAYAQRRWGITFS